MSWLQLGPACTWVMSRIRIPESAWFMVSSSLAVGGVRAVALQSRRPISPAPPAPDRSGTPSSDAPYLYMVWRRVPGAYSFGSTQMLTTADLPDERTASRAR